MTFGANVTGVPSACCLSLKIDFLHACLFYHMYISNALRTRPPNHTVHVHWQNILAVLGSASCHSYLFPSLFFSISPVCTLQPVSVLVFLIIMTGDM